MTSEAKDLAASSQEVKSVAARFSEECGCEVQEILGFEAAKGAVDTV